MEEPVWEEKGQEQSPACVKADLPVSIASVSNNNTSLNTLFDDQIEVASSRFKGHLY